MSVIRNAFTREGCRAAVAAASMRFGFGDGRGATNVEPAPTGAGPSSRDHRRPLRPAALLVACLAVLLFLAPQARA